MPEPRAHDPNQTTALPAAAPSTTLDATGAFHSAVSTEPSHTTANTTFPTILGYTITKEIARGGMGRVLAGYELALEREVAIKVLLPNANPQRFLTEAKITAKLPHPNIPPVYALGALGVLDDQSPYLAMKFVRGETLAAVLAKRAVTSDDWSRLVPILEQIAQAVGFAHAQGIIHRDLKPANVMVGAFGEVQVMDWGLAKEHHTVEQPPEAIVPTDSDGTQAGTIMGTPSYMAPEQARGEAVDARADVFALGGMLAAVLTGQPPFTGGTPARIIALAASGDTSAVYARLLACRADAELVTITQQCLQSDASKRPADGLAVATLLRDYRQRVDERLRHAEQARVAAETKALEQHKRRRLQLALLATAVLLLLGGGAFAWWQHEQHLRQEHTAFLLQQEHDFKTAQAEQGITANIRLAHDLRTQYKFTAAAQALAQARELTKGAEQFSSVVQQADDDLALAIELDEVRFSKYVWLVDENGIGRYQTQGANERYRQVFAKFKYKFDSVTTPILVERLRTSAIKDDIVAAIDDWAYYETNAEHRTRLFALSRQLDPGGWTDRLRQSKLTAAEVQALVADMPEQTPAPTIYSLLAKWMKRYQLDPSTLLQAARTRYPANFELAFTHGRHYTDARKDIFRGIGPYEAARSLRPDSMAALNNLAGAYHANGQVEHAQTLYRQAITMEPRFSGNYAAYSYSLTLRNKMAEARTVLEQGLAILPIHPGLHREYARTLRTFGSLDEARRAAERAVELDPDNADSNNVLGLVCQEQECFAEALVAYRRAQQQDPENPSILVNLGNTFSQMNDLEAALNAYQEALKHQPDFAPAYYNRAIVLRNKKEPVAARTACEQAMRLRDADPQNYALYGQILSDLKDYPGALAAYRKALELNPYAAKTHADLGLLLTKMKDPMGALASFRKALELGPLNPSIHADFGRVLQSQRDERGAIAAYREALKLRPKDAKTSTNLCSALQSIKDYDAALEACQQALKSDPQYAPAYVQLGLLRFRRNEFEPARTAFRKAIELDPKNANAHVRYGDFLRDTRDLKGAIASYQKALEFEPDHARAYSGLGICYGMSGDNSKALAQLAKAVELNPDDAAIQYNFGYAHFKNNDDATALRAYQRAAQLDPKYTSAHYNAGNILLTQGDHKGAIAAYLKVLELAPQHVARFNLGLIYFREKRYEDCIATLRVWLKSSPKYDDAHAMLGLCLWYTGETEAARDAFRAAIRLNPKKHEPLYTKYLNGDEKPVSKSSKEGLREIGPPPREVKP